MKTSYIGCYQVPDGYFGDKAIIHLCYDNQTHHTIEVAVEGYFNSIIPCATSIEEAIWLMENYPTCKGRYK